MSKQTLLGICDIVKTISICSMSYITTELDLEILCSTIML
ncbi:17607_t:CDS:2 [Dentiscutata erythropus]|uniref:17607_t:CDS:1 n=1 Tax=Dentiscutata erythropus TaxID=1348616 RepID=A0A9N9CI50_9GLOM|nr:17607_t:CDS:2 [Dentiscutata erythropus]